MLVNDDTGAGAVPRRRGRSWWLAAGAACTAAALATGCLLVWSWLARNGETEHRSYRRPVARIVVDLENGDLTVAPGTTWEVTLDRRLTWSLLRPTVQESWDGGTLHLRARCHGGLPPHCAVSYVLHVPADVPVDARLSAGEISVRAATGPLRLTTGAGDIDVTGAQGNVSMQSSSGDVRAADMRSAVVDARSSSGDVVLDFQRPPARVRATTRGGNAEVTVPQGTAYSIDAETRHGDRDVTLDDEPTAPHTITARTVSGDVVVSSTGS